MCLSKYKFESNSWIEDLENNYIDINRPSQTSLVPKGNKKLKANCKK